MIPLPSFSASFLLSLFWQQLPSLFHEGKLEELHRIVTEDRRRRSQGMTPSKGMTDVRYQRKESIKRNAVHTATL